jgi:hypothetical protein
MMFGYNLLNALAWDTRMERVAADDPGQVFLVVALESRRSAGSSSVFRPFPYCVRATWNKPPFNLSIHVYAFLTSVTVAYVPLMRPLIPKLMTCRDARVTLCPQLGVV